MAEKKQQLAQFSRDAEVRAESFDADANTVEIVWTTGASVRRYSWLDGEEYDEVLSLEPGAVRLGRLNLGAPFLDTHCSYSLENVIGSVVPDSARIADGKGTATIKLSKAERAADTVQDIKDGVIRNISVGYWIHKVVKTEGDSGTVARWDVVDWEPLEVSAVPIPADPGSQIRSEAAAQDGSGPATRSCTIITQKSPAKAPVSKATNTETRMAPRTRTAAPKTPKAAEKRLADLEAENKRLASLLAKRADDDDDKKDDEERDADDDKKDSDDERDADDDKKDDDADADEERDDDMDDEERDADEDEDKDKKGDKRTAPSAASVRAAATAAVKAERERSAEITAIAERAGLPKLGRKHIDKGTSVRGFKNILLERMLDKQDKDAPIRGLSADGDVVRERGSKAPNSQERQMAEGAAHWRKVAGKVEKA